MQIRLEEFEAVKKPYFGLEHCPTIALGFFLYFAPFTNC